MWVNGGSRSGEVRRNREGEERGNFCEVRRESERRVIRGSEVKLVEWSRVNDKGG